MAASVTVRPRLDVSNIEVPLDDIRAEGNIRSFSANDQAMKDLVDSVSALGVLEPVLLAPLRSREHRFQLVVGFRRYTAFKAGLDTIPARLLRQLSEAQITEVRLSENFHRLQMNPLEEARAIRDYVAKVGVTQEQAARKLGRSGFYVSTTIRLLDLPPRVQELVEDGKLSASRARQLLPYVGKESDAWVLRAASAGVSSQGGENGGFAHVLKSLSSSVRTTRLASRAGPLCTCSCSCCRSRMPHPGLG